MHSTNCWLCLILCHFLAEVFLNYFHLIFVRVFNYVTYFFASTFCRYICSVSYAICTFAVWPATLCAPCRILYLFTLRFSSIRFHPQRIAIVTLLCTPEVCKIILALFFFSAFGIVVSRCCFKYLPLRVNGGWMTSSAVKSECLLCLPNYTAYVNCAYGSAGTSGELFFTRNRI